MTAKHTAWVVFATPFMLVGCLLALSLKSSPGPSTPVVAREMIQRIVPASWKIVPANQELIDTAKEYFPDGRVQTLALVGPGIDHLRWKDHQGGVHVEDWSQECLLLWIIPSKFKPKFPNFLDHMVSGEMLPTCIFSSKHVCVYAQVTNSGTDLDRLREIGKDCTMISTDAVNPTWVSWAQDIDAQLKKAENNHGAL